MIIIKLRKGCYGRCRYLDVNETISSKNPSLFMHLLTFTKSLTEGAGTKGQDIAFCRCCYITVDSETTALQNGACTYRCICKQMHTLSQYG